MKKSLFFKLMLLLVLPAVIVAQSATTGAITGVVVNNDGTPLSGVAIKAVHVPTGTTFNVVSRTGGFYLIPAVKAGGPYTVTAAITGFRTEKKTGIVVKLGEKAQVNFALQLATVDAGEVVVTGVEEIINKSRTGATQNVAQNVIEDLPTISRTLSDFTRLAPQFASGEDAGSFSAAGRNSKYNNIQIDGAQNNDLFGLDLSGTPGGQAESTPISLDVVQEFQIVLAPYDVRHGGFTGGGINVITKSGTNEFHGSVYYEGRNENFVGNGPSDYEFSKFSDKTYGVSLGGPIIKNKLFFFFNAEQTLAKTPEDIYIDGSGADYDFGHKDEADRIINILKGKYGYDAGGYGQVSNETKSTKIFFRLDWNINDKHRLTLRNNYVDSSHERLDRSSYTQLWLGNAGRIYKNTNNSTVLQLNSNFSEKLFNELIVNVTSIHDNPTYMGKPFPNLTIYTGTGVSFKAGSEEYRMRNDLKQDLVEITDNLTMYSGKHTYIFGTHNEFFSFYNVFIMREFGKYSFNSIDDLEDGNPSYYDRYYSVTDNPNAPAEFNVAQLGFYAGDEWAVNNKLTLTYGLRGDVPLMNDTPPANAAVLASFGIPTDQNAGGNMLWSPRLGFNYDLKGDNSFQIRGGLGVFSGRAPYVWISNQFSNTATEIARYKNYNPDFFIADPYNQPDNPFAVTSGDINLIDKDFKFPQVFRMNFAVDKKLFAGFTGTFEWLYSTNINDVKFANINLQKTGDVLFDGRPLFGQSSESKYSYGRPDYVDPSFGNVILLSNTNEGYEYSLTFQIQKLWAGNMINAAYTYGEAKSLFGGTSSRAISNWGYNITTGDPNNPKLSWSPHDTRHRIMFAMTKQFHFFKKATTSFSMFYNGRSGRPYSTRFYNDVNGDGRTNDAVWLPATADDIILTNGTWEDLDKYIKDDPDGLDKYRGKIVPRNSSRDPWSHFVDIKITQSIPLPFKGQKLQVALTVENFLNMLNKDWGVYKYIAYDESPLIYEGIDSATGKPKMSFVGRADDDARYTINQLLSRWKAMLGLRYTF